MILAVSFAMALFICSALVPMMMRLAPTLGLVDLPDQRKVHENPIPRAGGVAIVLAFFIPVLVWYQGGEALWSLLLGAAIIALFGFLDDRHNLAYQWKFAAQFLAVIVFLAGDISITKTPFLGLGDLAPWLCYPLIALFILGVTNAVNLSDGLDGLAAGASLLSLGFIALIAYTITEYGIALLAVTTMGALTGFLRFNTHPASIFMGDTGSQFLGFMTASLAILVTQSELTPVSPILAVLIVGLPILDTLMVMALRLRSRVSPFKPDKRHMHHQLMAAGLRHYQAVAAIYLLNVILLVLAYYLRYSMDWIVFAAYLVFGLSVLFGLGFARHSDFAQRRRAAIAKKTERRNPFFRRLGWFHKRGSVIIQLLLGVTCVAFVSVGSPDDFGFATILIACGMIVTLIWWFRFPDSALLSRAVAYAACVCAIYVGVYERIIDVPAWRQLALIDVFLGVLVIALALAIRTTRKEQFRLDNQDLLVLIMLFVAAVLAGGGADNEAVARAMVRLVIVLYAAEFVISRAGSNRVFGSFCILIWGILALKLLL